MEQNNQNKMKFTNNVGRSIRSKSIGAANVLRTRLSDVSSNPLDHIRSYVGEFFGTAMFIYLNLAVGAADLTNVAAKNSNADNSEMYTRVLRSAFVGGGALTAFIFALAHVSGGHLNPAVTLTTMVVRALPFFVGLFYILAQFLGSIVAAGLFMATVGTNIPNPASTFGLVPSVSLGSAFLVQFVVSLMLCWVVLATGVDSHGTEPRNFLAPLPIGIALGVGIAIAAPIIGSSMNPAGTFGPMLLYNTWTNAWIYLIGPLVAAFVISVVYKLIFTTRKHSPFLNKLTAIRNKLSISEPRKQDNYDNDNDNDNDKTEEKQKDEPSDIVITM